MVAIAKRYSADEGVDPLRQQGYPEEMIEAMGGAGARTFKCRGWMGVGRDRQVWHVSLANTLALLDTHVRGVRTGGGEGRAHVVELYVARRPGPGHPFTTGLQASDEDFNDLRNFATAHSVRQEPG